MDIEKGSPECSRTADSDAVLASKEEGLRTHDEDVVWWDEPVDQDQSNPMNWSGKKKLGNIAILSGMTLVTCVLKPPRVS